MAREWQEDEESDTVEFTSTISGIGQWVGLIDTTLSMRDDYASEFEGREDNFMEVVQVQLDRYGWFMERADDLRPIEECRQVLAERPDSPAAWEQALVELSLWACTKAELALEAWEPPPGDLEMELFHQICLTSCRRPYKS